MRILSTQLASIFQLKESYLNGRQYIKMNSRFKFFNNLPSINPDLEALLYDPLEPNNFIQQNYIPLTVIGSGAFSVVLECLNSEKRQKVAIKVINKLRIKKSSLQMVVQEAAFLKRLAHRDVVRFIDHRESASKVYIITQLVKGRSLQNIIDTEQLSSLTIRQIVKELCEGLNYIHSQDIIHRDLKPVDNIIIESLSDSNCQLKIIDFGLSFQKNKEILITQQNCGTLLYMAPEVVFGNQYNQKVDVWSLGIIQYVLYSKGKHPLYDETESRSSYLEKMANFDFEWTNFPPNMDKQAINFFVKTTARLPENRISTRQSLEHPWITDNPEIEPPKTMDDWIKEIEKLKNCEQNFKAILVLMKIVAISNKEVKGEKQQKEFIISRQKRPALLHLDLLSEEQTETSDQNYLTGENYTVFQKNEGELSPIRSRQVSDQMNPGNKSVNLNLMKRNYSLHTVNIKQRVLNQLATPIRLAEEIVTHRHQYSDGIAKHFNTNRTYKTFNYLNESEDDKSMKSDLRFHLPPLEQTQKSKFWKNANVNENKLQRMQRKNVLNSGS